jgi:error-prone DNA polymerase
MSPRVRIDPCSRLPLDPVPPERATGRERPPTGSYVELTARTNFSFLRGASSPEAILQRAAELGYDAIAVADCDGLYGMVRALEESEKLGVALVVGCELTIDDAATNLPIGALTVYVETHAGYTNLCRILTESHARHPKGGPRKSEAARRDVHGASARNLFAGVTIDFVCANAEGLWALVHPSSHLAPIADADLAALARAFGDRLSLSVHRHLDGDDRARVAATIALAENYGVAICATNDVRYARREEKPVLDVLHCIREGTTLDRAGRSLAPNAEAHLKSHEEMSRLFADHPEWLARSRVVADACRFSLRELKYRFPCEIPCAADGAPAPSDRPAFEGETPDEALRRLTYDGAHDRYPDGLPEKVRAQIEKELALIARLEVAPYFLSVRTIVDIARARDILCQGRGSAANSAVCYCLGVTAVDPARTNLLFERFLSAERREPPDIDVDFEHERREEVIQELYRRYGRDRAAMVSEVISYRGKSALREVGKVFGLSLEQVDRLSTLVSWWDKLDELPAERVRACGFDPNDARVRHVLVFARAIQGFPRHLSIHVGGFVLSAAPLVEVAPIEPATMPDRTVVPWDKDDVDTLGFFKVDVLGLGMLTAIRKMLDFVGDAKLSAIDRLARIPAEDASVYDALCEADSVGVFQIESRAQMSMLPRLRPRSFYDLVVEVAIVRPGPIQGGMIHPYLRRRNGEEAVDSPHPSLDPILERTLGVPLFQEQVMQIAIVGAGYTGGEADQLRRDMAAWKKNGKLARHKQRLFDGFAARGISADFAERLYKQIQGFGEYGFPESHAASFALLVYASAWLKVHHAAAFAAALVNSQPMGFYSPSTIFQDAQRHGVEVRAVCIQRSDWDCTLEPSSRGREPEGPAIRVGLRQVRGLGEEAGRRIEAAKRARAFESVEDLASRASLDRRELEALAESGALEELARGRRGAIWKVRAPRGPGKRATEGQGWLFEGHELGDEAPMLPDLSRAETLVLDYERTGMSVGDHPMRFLRPSLSKRIKSATELAKMPHGARASAAGLVICRQRPGTASGVVFVTMEDETGFLNLVLWAKVFDAQRHVATTSSLLLAHGRIERTTTKKEGEKPTDVVYLVVDRLEPLAMNVPAMSRDFH